MKLLKAFYIYSLVASLMTINNNWNNLLNPTIIISLIGIVGSILFFLKKYNFYFLGIIWLIVQIPYFEIGNFTFDLSQFVNFHLNIDIASLSLGINFQIILIYFFLKPLLLSKFLLQKITFSAYTENSKLQIGKEYSFIPTEIESKKLIGKNEIQIEKETYSRIEFEPEKSDRIKKAGITLIPINKGLKIKALVKYKMNNNVW
jgi:hypothetical protein